MLSIDKRKKEKKEKKRDLTKVRVCDFEKEREKEMNDMKYI